MSKSEYFKELHYRLRGLPEKERQNILSVYEELFQKAIENGKNEEDVAESLGYPRVPNWDASKEASNTQQDPVKRSSVDEQEQQEPFYRKTESAPPMYEPERHAPYTQAYPPPFSPPYPPYPTKPESGIKAIIVSIALGFFNLFFVVGPWFGILGALIAMFGSGIALIIAPIIGVIGSFTDSAGNDLKLIFFAMLACFGLGIILTTLSSWLLKWFFKLTWSYIQFNAKLIKGA